MKQYRAATVKEAMEKAKAELGSDAVLLHEKKVKTGGLLGFGAREYYEVFVAVDDAQPVRTEKSGAAPRKSRSKTQTRRPATASRGEATSQSGSTSRVVPVAPVQSEGSASSVISRKTAAAQYQSSGTRQSVDDAQERANRYDAAQNQPSFSEILSSLERVTPEEDLRPIEEPVSLGGSQPASAVVDRPARPVRIIRPLEKKSVNNGMASDSQQGRKSQAEGIADAMAKFNALNQDEYAVQGGTPGPNNGAEIQAQGDKEKIQSLQNELEEMKEVLARMTTGRQDNGEISLQQAMLDCDVDDRVIKDMVRKLTGAEILSEKTSLTAHKALEKYLKKTVRVASGITLFSNKPKIVALIGPTGVGKTTTLAKIAAKFVLENAVSTALITADTYRISAVEQLKTYSDILGLPLEIVYSAEALQQAIRKHSDKKLILIDTAGRSQYNESQMKELCDLLAVDADIEKHLVMSSTTKNRDAEEILSRFSPCQPERVIFTKTDETSSLGILLNLLCKRKIALSYMTNGQSVPDDIVPASFGKLADMLLR